MKPISLHMQAFGPFSGKETITFSDLGESPLFLINGPTGSGKTTILDAISYALYGSTTGNERDARDMRCQQSDPKLLTEVTFVFSLGGSSYNITRSPDQMRPKKVGDGSTAHKSAATLYKLGPHGSKDSGELLVDKKVSEATDYIRSITGLNAEQFRQVMVLPQGQFRKLLMADSKDKQKIFQSLFQTSIYSKIEERLKEDSKEVRSALEQIQSVIRNILETGGAENEQDLEERIEETSTELGVLKTNSDNTQSAWATADKALHDANKLKEGFEELETVKQRETELSADSVKMVTEKDQAKQAHAAEKLMPVYRRVTEAEGVLHKTNEEIAEAQSTLGSAESHYRKSDSAHEAEKSREADRAAAGSKVHELKSYLGKAEALAEAKKALESSKDSERDEDTKQTQCKQTLDDHLPGEAKIQKHIDSLHASIATAEGIDLKVHKLTETLGARRQISVLETHLLKAKEEHLQAEKHLTETESARDQADKGLKRLRQTWHKGQAAQLAEELAEDSPCPVCGSIEHPSPATKASEMVSDEQLEKANAELEEKTRLMIAASGSVSTCAQHVKALDADINKSLKDLGKQSQQGEEDIAAELADATEIANKLVEDREELVSEQRALKHHAEHATALRGALDTAKAALATAQQETGKAQTRFELSEKALPEAYRAVGKVEDELTEAVANQENLNKALEQTLQAFQAADKAHGEAQASLSQLQRNCKKNEHSLSGAQADWAEALSASDFSTEQEMQLASMSEEDLHKEDRIRRL